MRTMLRAALLIACMSSAARVGADAAGGAPYALNMKDVDINAVVATVAEITGKTFVVDARVQGKVNVISTQAASKQELYEMFLSILRVNGFAAIDDGTSIRIVPESIAAQDGNVGLSDGRMGDDMTTRMITLKHMNPNEVITVLRPLIPQTGQMLAHAQSNSIIVADRLSNVLRLEAIIKRLDQASQSDIEVLPLQYANAAEIARMLAQLNGTADGGKLVADQRTNSIIMSGEPSKRLKLKALVAVLDTPLNANDSAQVIYLRYAKAEQIAPILDAMLKGGALAASAPPGGGGGSNSVQASGNTLIQAHKETNALIISAPPAVFRAVQDVVRKLDIRRAQVHIEAIVAEVSDETAKELGIQWQATQDNFNGNGFIGGTNFPGAQGSGGILGATLNPLALGASPGLNLGYVRGTFRLPGSDTELIRLGALAKALASNNDTNILSTPSTTVLDNETAELSVGQEVPFLTGQYATNASTGGQGITPGGGQGSGLVNPFQTIERKEVGLKLKVTPSVNEGDSVKLAIELEVSSLAPSSAQGAVDLITNTRRLSSSVLVRDNGLLVIGGLTNEELKETEQRVPGLGSIPLLGNLFKYRSTTKQKRNLLVFLRPIIVRDAFSEEVVSSEKYNFLRAEQLRVREKASYLVPKETVPVMPEYKDFLREGFGDPQSDAESVPMREAPQPGTQPRADSGSAREAGALTSEYRVTPALALALESDADRPPMAPARARESPVVTMPRAEADAAINAVAFFLKLGAYETEARAQELTRKLKQIQIDAKVMPVEVDGQRLYRLGSRPYETRREAEAAAAKIQFAINGMQVQVIRRKGPFAQYAAELGWVP